MRFVIVGNGVAGNTVASTIRRYDSSADITIVSDEKYAHYSACGLPHFLAGEMSQRSLFIRTKESYKKDNIKALLGQKVLSVDAANKKIALESKNLDYDKLVLATGARPLMPPIDGIKLPGVYSFKWLDDALKIRSNIPRTAVIVGTGPVGVEAGIALTKRGAKVYFVEMLPRVMPRIFDDKASSLISNVLQQHGIEVMTGERVMKISGTDKVEGIVTDKRQIACDLLIMAAGMRANIDLAKQVGLATGKMGGVTVNDKMETSILDIYSCGDCAEAADLLTGNPILIQLWHNAREQGEVVGSNMLGKPRPYGGSINITSLEVFGTHLVSFGSVAADVIQRPGIEVIAKQHDGNYHQIVLENDHLIGAQFIGDARDMGAVLYALIRKQKLSEFREYGTGRPTIDMLLHNYRLRPFVTAKQALKV